MTTRGSATFDRSGSSALPPTIVERPPADSPSEASTSSSPGRDVTGSTGPNSAIPRTSAGTISVPPATSSMMPTVIHLPARRTLVPWLVVAGVLVLVLLFRQAITLGFVAFAAAYVFAPTVRRVHRLGVPRPLAIGLVLLTAGALVAAVVSVLLPELARQVQALFRSIPDYAIAIQHRWIPWMRTHWHLPISPHTEDTLSQIGLRASSMMPRIEAVVNGTVAYTLVILELVVTSLIVSALTFYMLLEYDRIIEVTFDLMPHRARGRVRAIAHEIDDTLRHFVHGQVLVMAVLGLLYALGLGLLGVPAGWAIGLFAGMISFVPYLGFFVALGLALFMTALQGTGFAPMLAVAGIMTAVHILDLTLITPRILGGQAKISPATAILALIAGGSVFGFVGFIGAIPAASVLKVLLRELVNYYKTTNFFLAGREAAETQSMAWGSDPLASDISGPYFTPSPTVSGSATGSTPPSRGAMPPAEVAVTAEVVTAAGAMRAPREP